MDNSDKAIEDVIKAFGLKGRLVDIKSNKQGHINSTFISVFDNDGKIEKYTHQKINKNVFAHPEEVMDNIVRVTDYIYDRIDLKDKERLVLQVVRTLDNTPYYIDSDDEYWRTYRYIDNAIAYDRCSSADIAEKLGSAIGNFQLLLSGFDGSSLYPTIKNFHNMAMRYENLIKAMDEDKMGRRSEVKPELDFLFENRSRGEIIWNDYISGMVPSRVTHNDTKINNVLFDLDTKKPLAVIDLDTIMPGTILFDTGDMIRTSCNTAEEDEKDLDKVEFDVDLYQALLNGYISKARVFLTDKELEGIIDSGRMMPQIMAVRFLTDYLDGDVYYKIKYPDHNLVRARNQIKLIKSMDSNWDKIKSITDDMIK